MLAASVMPIHVLGNDLAFPDALRADAHGIVAVGGDLCPARILRAYSLGIFPWPIPGLPLTWFSPNPRMVLKPQEVVVSRSMRRVFRRGEFRFTMDRAFGEVIAACASTARAGECDTWITPSMIAGFSELHEEGFAHSVEVWREGELVGGLYGVSLGRMFCGESMFYRVANASKAAFIVLARQLARWDFDFIDCQLPTAHLASLGAEPRERGAFLHALREVLRHPTRQESWHLDREHVQCC